MNTTTEVEVIEEQNIEATQDAASVRLSLSELDMVGGGSPISVFI